MFAPLFVPIELHPEKPSETQRVLHERPIDAPTFRITLGGSVSGSGTCAGTCVGIIGIFSIYSELGSEKLCSYALTSTVILLLDLGKSNSTQSSFVSLHTATESKYVGQDSQLF